jgi:ribulose-5-phosphate 4-epimerase/fuculose-1-phosphate aldolase
MSAPCEALTSAVLKAWRFLCRRGFIEGFGHLSVRLPGADRFIITRHSLGMPATARDLVLIDLDGRKLEGEGELPGEYPIHLEILRARPDVGSVLHYHGMYSTAFTTSRSELRPVHLLGTIFHDGIPVHADPRLVSDRVRGTALAKTLGSHRAVLMRAHGATIVGADIQETVAGAFLFEENAHRAYLSAPLGGPVWLDRDLAASAGGELIAGRGPFRRVWALVESEDSACGLPQPPASRVNSKGEQTN